MALNCGCNNGYNRALNDKDSRDAWQKIIDAHSTDTVKTYSNLSFTDKMMMNPGGTAVAAIGGAGLLFAGLKLAKKIR